MTLLTALAGDELEFEDVSLVPCPLAHLAVRLPALLRQLVPRLGLRQQLTHRAL